VDAIVTACLGFVSGGDGGRFTGTGDREGLHDRESPFPACLVVVARLGSVSGGDGGKSPIVGVREGLDDGCGRTLVGVTGVDGRSAWFICRSFPPRFVLHISDCIDSQILSCTSPSFQLTLQCLLHKQSAIQGLNVLRTHALAYSTICKSFRASQQLVTSPFHIRRT
jgi:hypothetical protein